MLYCQTDEVWVANVPLAVKGEDFMDSPSVCAQDEKIAYGKGYKAASVPFVSHIILHIGQEQPSELETCVAWWSFISTAGFSTTSNNIMNTAAARRKVMRLLSGSLLISVLSVRRSSERVITSSTCHSDGGRDTLPRRAAVCQGHL